MYVTLIPFRFGESNRKRAGSNCGFICKRGAGAKRASGVLFLGHVSSVGVNTQLVPLIRSVKNSSHKGCHSRRIDEPGARIARLLNVVLVSKTSLVIFLTSTCLSVRSFHHCDQLVSVAVEFYKAI